MGLFDLFSSSNEQDAYQAQRHGYKQGQAGAEKFIGRGIDEISKIYGKGLDLYKGLDDYKPNNQYIGELAQRGGGYLDAYGDALGLNGQRGTNQAQDRFQESAGYQFQVDQATQAAQRAGASSGLLGSGNTLAAVADRTGQVANTEYGNYLSRLGGMAQMGYGGIGTAAGLTTNENQFASNYDLNRTQGAAGLYGQQAGQVMGGYNAMAGNAYGAGVGIGQAQGQYLTSLDQTGANIFGTGLGIAGAVAGFPGIGGAVGTSGVGGGINARPYSYGGPR